MTKVEHVEVQTDGLIRVRLSFQKPGEESPRTHRVSFRADGSLTSAISTISNLIALTGEGVIDATDRVLIEQHYADWLAAGNTPTPEKPPTPAQLAGRAAAVKDAQDVEAAKGSAKLAALKAMTPAQIQTWAAANVTTLAQARDAITTLAIAVSVLARRL